ncbi:MAG: lipoyl synthase, partial [Actinomycetota bacterium]|nr:lipoyl synthase [Actinomycetota bacterium]
EREAEIGELLTDLRGAGVEILTVGQYLRPAVDCLPVQRYVSPEEFGEIKRYAIELGFIAVESGPFVRSSRRAGALLEEVISLTK